MKFYCSCVNWPKKDVYPEGGLTDMIEQSQQITRQTFTRNVNRESLKVIEKHLGYRKAFPMSQDPHVTYHKSKLHEEKVYFFTHSAIEHVFKREERQ